MTLLGQEQHKSHLTCISRTSIYRDRHLAGENVINSKWTQVRRSTISTTDLTSVSSTARVRHEAGPDPSFNSPYIGVDPLKGAASSFLNCDLDFARVFAYLYLKYNELEISSASPSWPLKTNLSRCRLAEHIGNLEPVASDAKLERSR